MDSDIKQRIEDMDRKIDAILASTESTKKHAKAMLWITIALVVLPAIGLVFAIPSFLETYSAALNF
jgi:hypothetical protein